MLLALAQWLTQYERAFNVFGYLTLRAVLVYQMSEAAHAEACAWITAALEAGQLQHPIDKVYGLDEIVLAHQACESMKNLGKVLVRID